MKFSDFSDGLTYEDVQVGLDPSAGSGLVTLDSDCNGVFKITNKSTQVLKVIQSDGTHTLTQTFDLSGLTLAPPAHNVVTPSYVTIDKNESGENYGEKVLTVIPATSNATISKLYLQTGASPDPTSDTEATSNMYTIDSTGLVITLIAGFAENIPVGSYTAYVTLTDNSIASVALAIEDTT